MDRNDIFDKVKDIIGEQLGIDDPESAIRPETDLVKDLEADSLAVVEVIMALEEEFGNEIPDDEVEQFKSVEDIVNYIEENA